MFNISASQVSRLNSQANLDFRARLLEHLIERCPEFLPRFPIEQREQIVEYMVARVQATGAVWESSIAKLTEMMEVFAPNLLADRQVARLIAVDHPDIERLEKFPVDRRVEHFHKFMSEEDWLRVVAARSELPLYTPPELDNAPLSDRIEFALPLVLWDRMPKERVAEYAAWGIKAADASGFAAHEDAALALVGWAVLYDREALQPWMNDIRDPVHPPSERLEMLRYRIMLDHGRRV